MGTETVQAHSRFDMHHGGTVIGQVLANGRPGGESGEFDNLDSFSDCMAIK